MDIIQTKIEVINSIKPILIESFVEYYGEENRSKIENIINNLIIVFMEKNLSLETIDKKQNFVKNKIFNILNNKLNYNVNDNNFINIIYTILLIEEKNATLKILEDKILKYFYYDLLKSKKKNDKNKKIYLGATKLINDEFKNKVKDIDTLTEGAADLLGDDYLILIQGSTIPISTLIHEITHFLSKEIQVEIFEEGIKKDDIINYVTANQNDLINEIITELLTKKVLEIFKRKCTNNFMLDFKYDSGYFQLEKVSHNTISYIFTKLEHHIKKFIIHGEGFKIKNIIGKNTYSKLTRALNFNLYTMKELAKNTDIKRLEDIINSEAFIKQEHFDEIKDEIDKNYEEYLTYTENLNNLVDDLVATDQAKRVK